MSKPKSQLPENFEISEEMRQWANQKVPRLDIDYYHDEFCDHWLGNGKMMVNWVSTWRNWMRRTETGAGPGLYGPDDKSIKRKSLQSVPDINHKPTQAELSMSMLDHLRDKAVAAGMDFIEARHTDHLGLNEYIKKRIAK